MSNGTKERGTNQIIQPGGSTKTGRGVDPEKVRIVRLLTGQEIIAETKKNSDGSLHLLHPMIIGIRQLEQGKVDMHLQPFLPFAQEDDVTLSKKFADDAVVCIYTPFEGITEKYRQAFSNIVLPSKGITAPSAILTE